MTDVRTGLVVSLAERYLVIGMQLVGSMILARLLAPEEIGIYSVCLALVGIAQVVRDFGIGPFLVQERDLTEAHIRTAFGFALVIGSILFLVVYMAGPLVGRFYAERRLVETIRVSAFNFLVLPFCSISLALLRRNLAFKRLASVNIAAAIAGLLTGISLAYMGFGPDSLAFGSVVSNMVTGILAWYVRADRKLLLPGFSEWRKVLRFGSQSSASAVVTTVAMDINGLVLGKILGFAPVAMLSRAQGLMNVFHRDIMTAIRNVVFPVFARAHQEGESVEARYVASVVAVTAFAWPFYGFAALYSDQLIRLMFGPQWGESAALVPIFCLAGTFAATCNLLLNVVLAVGRIDLVTRAELTIQPLRVLLIVAAALVFKSLMACAVAFAIVFILMVPFLYRVKDRCIPTDYWALGRGLFTNVKLAALTLVLPAVYATQLPDRQDVLEMAALLIGATALTGLSWLAALFVLDHPLRKDPLVRRVIGRLPGLTQV